MKCKQQIIFKANQSSSPYFVGDTILNLGQNPSNSDQTSKNLQVYIGFLIFHYHHIMANLKWSPAKNYATNISPFIYGSKMKQTSVVAKVPIQSFQSYQIFRTLPLCNIPIVWKIDSNLGVIMSIHPSMSGWWFQPLWKIWVRQLGWLFPIYGKYNSCSKPPNSDYILYKTPLKTIMVKLII